MPRNVKEIGDLIDLVAERYRVEFCEQLPREVFTKFVEKLYEERQEILWDKMLNHLPSSDIVLMKGLLSGAIKEEVPRVVEFKPSGKKEDLKGGPRGLHGKGASPRP